MEEDEDTLSVTTAPQTQQLTNMSVERFKETIKAKEIQILCNPHTDKLFASDGNGKNYRVEQGLDLTKAVSVLIPVNEEGEPVLADACFINTRTSAAVIATL